MAYAKLFVVSAPSGAGKTTLVTELLQSLPAGCCLERVVTYTTRMPRPKETDIHYHFMSAEQFKERIQEGFFLEWSSWYGNYYGSPKSVLEKLKKGISLIMILDRSGARAIKALVPKAELIWIKPPSLAVLEERLKKRGDDTASRIFRLERADLELKEEEKEHLFHHTIINDDKGRALIELRRIVCPKKSC